jgi:hypothetical protein
LELPAPLDDWGVVKGLLLRHFRWWSDKHDLFNVDGTLTIGFTYPNMYMSEDYNSPQSPYWALKSFLAVGLTEEHAFWTAPERPLPLAVGHSVEPIRPPVHLVCHTENHHFLLSMGQYCPWPLKATEAKYGKFAYSSQFGFSVPTGTLIQQIAPDNTLALSKDRGDTWRVPWKVSEYSFEKATVRSKDQVMESLPVLKSTWRPWKDAGVEVTTHLIPPSKRWPNWHLRLHRFKNRGQGEVHIHCIQGGFAIQGRGAGRGEVLPDTNGIASLNLDDSKAFLEGTLHTQDGALVCSNAGASGIRSIDMTRPQGVGNSRLTGTEQPEVLKPDANTNLMWQRTLIPTIKSEQHSRKDNSPASREPDTLASAVFAIARTADKEERYPSLDVGKLWEDVPILSASAAGDDHLDWYITLD